MKRKKEKNSPSSESGIVISMEEANSLTDWVPGPQKRCDVCGSICEYYISTSTVKTLCMYCCRGAIERELTESYADQWPVTQIKKALSPEGLMTERLAVLSHMDLIQYQLDLRELLIDNLGFVSNNPFSYSARQLAFDACDNYHDKQAMFKILINTRQFMNWQQQVNVAKLCYLLGPSDPRIIEKCQEAAAAQSPSARIYMAEMVSNISVPWAKELWESLYQDVNPLVREACQKIIAKGNSKASRPFPNTKNSRAGASSRSSKGKTQTTKVVFSEFEKQLHGMIDFRRVPYEKVYTRYLKDMLDLIDPDIIGKKVFKQMSANTQQGFIKLLAAILSDKMLFERLLKSLPAEAGVLLYYCTWGENVFVDKKALEDLISNANDYFDTPVPEKMALLIGEPFPPKTEWNKEIYQNSAFFLFNIRQTWNTSYSKSGYKFSIDPFLRDRLKLILPLPDGYHITPLKDLDLIPYFVHEANEFFEKISTLMAFIDQDNLEFTKNDKIKAASLKKMAAMCRIDEFYTTGSNSAQQRYLKSQLLADFFIAGTSWKEDAQEDLAASLKNRIQLYLNYKAYQTFRCRELLTHVKRQLEDYDNDKDEAAIRLSFLAVLKMLPQDEWVSVNNLAQVIKYRELPFSPFTNFIEIGHVQVNVAREYFEKQNQNIGNPIYSSKSSLDNMNEQDPVVVPLLKSLLFLFGALNVLELAYSDPKNDRICLAGSSYLTVYDGLAYVRLTDFGAYVLDLKKSYTVSIEKRSAEIIVDKGRLMLSIIGEDPVKQLALETVGRQITRSSYMVDYHSFLKDCTTPHDVENRIEYFRTYIEEKPPAVWESFFQSVLTRMAPMKSVEEMLIFKVQPDRELISHLSTDPVLKKYVMKAENYHLLIPQKAYSRVKKALKQLGYFHV